MGRPSLERGAEQFVHGFHRNETQVLFHLDGHIRQVFFIEFGDNHGLQAGTLGGEGLFLQAADRRTRPRRVISPVMAVSGRAGVSLNNDAKAANMATPAEGPSLGTAPAGT